MKRNLLALWWCSLIMLGAAMNTEPEDSQTLLMELQESADDEQGECENDEWQPERILRGRRLWSSGTCRPYISWEKCCDYWNATLNYCTGN